MITTAIEQKEQGMISVEEKLPEDPFPVLVLCDDIFDFDIGRYSKSKWRTRTFQDHFKVTHWSPLPKMPVSVAKKMADRIGKGVKAEHFTVATEVKRDDDRND